MLAETETAREPGRILIRNLDLSASKKDIEALFTKFGPLTENKMPTDRLKRHTGFAFATFKTAEQAATAISALKGTRFQGRILHLTPTEAENHPRGGLQRDATAEETPRRSGQSQGDTKGEISGPWSHNEAMLAETKTTGESGRTLGRNPSHSATDKNIGVGLQRDPTTGETLRRSGQS